MLENQIRKTLHRSILGLRNHLSSKDLKDNASLTLDLGFDSMALVSLAGELEKQFQKSLPFAQWIEEEKDKRLTLGSLVEFLKSF